ARQNPPAPLPAESALLPPTAPDHESAEQQFTALWRAELIDRTWEALRDDDGRQPYYAVLRWRVDHPDRTADDAARELGAGLGRPLTAAHYRQLLHRARERFAA